jgi:hypothetical protein
MDRAMSTVGAVKTVCKEKADIFGATPRAETEGGVTENALGPAKEAVMNDHLANAKSRICEVDGSPVGRVFAVAFLENQHQFASVHACRPVAGKALIDLQ